MNRLVRAELLKLRTARILHIALAVTAIVMIGLLALQLRNAGKVGAPSLGTVTSLRTMLGVVGTGLPIVLVVGVVAVTSEFGHGTIATSLLVVPDRRRLLLAKVAAAGLVGIAVAVAGFAVVLGIVLPYLAAASVPVDLANGELLLAVGSALISYPLWATAGVGIGALIRRQTAAVVIPLAYLTVGETLLGSYGFKAVLTWLPGGATNALGRAELPGLLPMWAGGLLLVAYAAALLLAGAHRLARTDVQ